MKRAAIPLVLLLLTAGFASSLAAQETMTGETTTAVTTTAPNPPSAYLYRRIAEIKVRANSCRRILRGSRFQGFPGRARTLEAQRVKVIGWKARRARVCGAVRYLNRHPVAAIRFVWPDYLEPQAIEVGSCESVRFTDFYNEGSGAAGVFQVMPLHYAGKFNPFPHLTNARFAYRLYQGNGWWPWLASNGCHGLL